MVKDAFKKLYQNDDHLLFGSRETAVEVFTLHPEQVQIFRLWQLYIENVNPLLKVTHTPTLQTRIIDAASNVASIKPTLAALMLSIYCVSILSLSEDECRTMFGSPKETLLSRYQFGCQQALLNCGFLRSSDRDCLTALHLYLVSLSVRLPSSCWPNSFRSRSDPLQIPNLCHPCSALRSVLHNAWDFTASRPMPNVPLSRLKCAEDFGGLSYSSTLAFARWSTTRSRC